MNNPAQDQIDLLKTGALQTAILNSANFSSIATDEQGVIQIFNIGAERMLGYKAADVLNQVTPADISDPSEILLRAAALSVEFGTAIAPGFEALVFKASRGIEDIYELTYVCKDGSRLPAVVSVTALRDARQAIIGYLLIGTDNTARKRAEEALIRAGALQSAIFNSANFSSIATDAKGVIQIFNVGAERMLGYAAADVLNRITPADISDPQEVIARAKALSAELGTAISPGFDALVFKARRGIEDIYELTYIRKDGSRFPAVVSVTALRDDQDEVIGYLLIATDNTARLQASQYARRLLEASLDPLVTISPDGKITDVNEGLIKVTGVARSELIGTDFSDYFTEPAKAREGYQQVFALGSVIDYPLTIRHYDGRLTDVLYNASLYKDSGGTVLGVFAAARDITARKQAEDALQKAGALQSAIFNSANFSSIATDAKGVIQIFNVGAERMLGYSAADVMDKITPAEISDPEEVITRAKSLSSELGTAITPGFEALVFKASRGIEDIYELTYIRKDGSRLPAVVSVTALRDDQGEVIGYLLIGTDNTARKQAEEALLRAGALQSAIFNSANFSSIATDAKGVIQIFNVGAERMLGYTADEVMNKITPADISDPLEVIVRAEALSLELGTTISPGFEALVFKASRAIEDIYELTYFRKDGSRFPAVVSVTALRDAAEAIIGYLLIGTDNTARKLVEAEQKRLDQVLRETNLELQDAKIEAERANLAKSDFLSSMSHELRSPLNAILGFAQLMDTGVPPLTAGQKESTWQILQAGWYLLKLINEILDLAQIESGKVPLSLEPVSLDELLADCQAMNEPQALKSGIRLVFAKPDTGLFVRADRTRLKQILLNLLSNGIKYNRVGGSVTVSCRPRPGDRVRVSFQDTGEGLALDRMGHLFEPFNRLDQESGVEEGTGIGLVVSKQLVELMGGSIGVESTVGVGSVFWIDLNASSPVEIGRDAASPVAAWLSDTITGIALRTVLYVEDNPANLMLVTKLLARRPDIRLLSAKDGRTGVEMAQATRPDVILMDINLPGISGYTALGILAADPSTAHIPVIALSANAMDRDIERGLEAGFFRYLTKPIKVTEFMDTLDLALEVARTLADRAGHEAVN